VRRATRIELLARLSLLRGTRARVGHLAADDFLRHRPDVVIDPAVPVSDCPLNESSRAHMREMTDHPWASRVRRIFASDEREPFAPGADPIGLFRGRGLDNLSLAE
jgi:hypothetical protein